MSVGLALFLSAIVIIALAGVCGLVVYLERNFPSEKYDERQKVARGNAYRFSHGVGMVYYIGLLAYFVFHTGKSEWAIEPFVLLANPPYGERMMEKKEAEEICRVMGRVFTPGEGRSYAIISPLENFEELFGRKANKRRKLYNGMIRCQLYLYF